ncbi:MAG: double-strand break repair helicase AddA [Rhodospirillaceae bacterium]|nr:double-strand break repair helicase AddA [Rhodospirillaceae bacterium]
MVFSGKGRELIAQPQTDPSIKQRPAANPNRSVWVAASAGTGKTKVLTDRVLALLLSGTPPHRLLCLTFTNAAAAEMANRINQVLAQWSIADETELRKNINFLMGQRAKNDILLRARKLFGQVLDVPGGMKIQTVHAFCESLLGRFPLEAGLAPYFQVMDEREAKEIQNEAQVRVFLEARNSPGTKLASALEEVTKHIQESDFEKLLGDFISERGRLCRLIERFGSVDLLINQIYRKLGVSKHETEFSIKKDACRKSNFDFHALRKTADAMAKGSKTDIKSSKKIKQWIEANFQEREKTFDSYLSVFFTLGGEKRARLVHKEAKALYSAAPKNLENEAKRLEYSLLRVRANVTGKATAAILTIINSLLEVYEKCKKERARLDYDDLILKARSLLEAEGNVSWVMFKLDGGIDHILIDEAQDTNPDQWAIITALSEEFFSGEGASKIERTIFAVGDPKQSIYSFQRADPKAFEEMRSYFRTKAIEISKPWKDVNLYISFRSTSSVLKIVDAVLASEPLKLGVAEAEKKILHEPLRYGEAGLVELWPPVGPIEQQELEPWSPPVKARSGYDPQTQLAEGIAATIQNWIKKGEILKSKNRPIRAGDIIILVRRRGTFVEKMVRALKREDLPVAGADRMVLSEHLAVLDLVSIGNFLLLPEDELNLAGVLKSPLIGFSEDDLFELAYNRGQSNLWKTLCCRYEEKPIFKFAFEELKALLETAESAPPFELFSEILGKRNGRKKIIGRLGSEANDPIDEFLTLALHYERTQTPSLQGFLNWFLKNDIEVKRDFEHAIRNEVRVMTVHGAKGLQAPIVFLPDSMQVPSGLPRLLWTEDEIILWPPRRRYFEKQCEKALLAARQVRDSEYRRLLYVAMTRTEDRLYICGWNTLRRAVSGNWYELVESALKKIGSEFNFDSSDICPQGWKGPGWRLENPQLQKAKNTDFEISIIKESLPDWVKKQPKPEAAYTQHLSPSHSEEYEPSVISPIGDGKIDFFQRGLIIHKLLELLPGIQMEKRRQVASRFLAQPVHQLTHEDQREYISEVMSIIENTQFKEVFGPDSRSEVTITGRLGAQVIVGQLDRLLIKSDQVMIIDYKSSRPPPEKLADVSPAYLRQMSSYRAVLYSIFPDRPINCALLWTYTPSLMPLPDVLLNRYSDHLDA